MRIHSIQTKIILWTGLTLLVTTLALITYSAVTLRNRVIQAAQDQALNAAQKQAASIEANIVSALDTARTMANELKAIKDPTNPISLTRDQVNAMLYQVLASNPQYLGTYTLWEPNAFDGQDAKYVNAPVHDQTGRFIPYWVHGDDGSIHTEALLNYETPGIGDWYLKPRSTKQEVIIPPFLYPIQGKDVLLTSLVVPVIQNGVFYGIAGVDLPIGFVQQNIDAINLYNGRAQAVLITNEGKLAAVGGKPELANQPASVIYPNYDALKAQLDSGQPFSTFSPDGQTLQVFAPINFGKTGVHWNIGVAIPYAVVTEAGTALLLQQLMFGLLLTALALVVLWFLAGQIARPVRSLTGTAQAITAGDLTAVARVNTADELGILANTFNQMTARLRELVGSLELRVAQRTQALTTSSEVSRRISTILTVQELVSAVVEDVQKAFDYYHVHIYLLDEGSDRLRMAGGTGEAGRIMLSRGHEILVGRGLVGRAAVTRKSVLAPDTANEPGWLPNPLLPETRSEAAVPIMIGSTVLGVLDVQDDVVDGLGAQDVELLQSIANQVAIALQNAGRVAETQAALTAAREAQESARQLSEFAPEAILIVDTETGLFLEPNENATRLYGMSREDLQKVGPAQMSPEFQPDGRLSSEKAMQMLLEALSGGAPVFEWYHINSRGQEIPCEVRLVRLPVANRRLVRASVTDITERLQAQRAIAQQAQELAMVAQVSTQSAAETDPQRLLTLATEQIKAGFGLYHAQVYLLNDLGDTLMLATGAGEVGRKMAASGWQIPLDRQHSLVARAAREGQGVIVNDVRTEPDFQPNPYLPLTAAELAVPLMFGGLLLGVLDLQADHAGRFTPADVAIQSTLAAQLAVTLQNASQYDATRQSEQLVRTIIEATQDWIYIKDGDHRYVLANPAFASAYGVKPEEMLGKDDLELGLPEFLVKGDPERGIAGFWTEDIRVMESGQPVFIPNQPIPLGNAARIFDVYKVPLLGAGKQVANVLTFARDVTERQQLQQETQARLEEIDGLYRTITRQSWQEFYGSGKRETAFYFDRSGGKRVEPAGDRWVDETAQAIHEKAPVQGGNGHPVLAAPLLLRGDPIGALAVEMDPERPLSEDEKNLLNEMAEQVALALESVRLFEQTQTALSTTESLYAGSEAVVRATDLDSVLLAMVESTPLSAFPFCALLAFDQPLPAGRLVERPDSALLAAVWRRSGSPVTVQGERGQRLDLTTAPLTDLLQAVLDNGQGRPFYLLDLGQDARLPEAARPLIQQSVGTSLAFFPLLAGEQWMGWVTAVASQPTALSDEQIRQVQTLTGQAATVIQSLKLLEQAQARARYERVLREVTAQVRTSTNPDTVLRTAAQEVSALLGRNVLIRLGSPGMKSGQASGQGNGEVQHE